MKKTLLNLALVASLGFTFGQNPGLNEVAAYDDFLDGSPFVTGNNPYAKLTDLPYWNDTTKATVANKKAYKGIYWWVDQAANSGLDFTWTRTNGKLSYSSVNQAASAYEPLGVGFGSYYNATTDTSAPFTVDLTSNKKVSLKINNTFSSDIEFAIALQDANGNLLNSGARGLKVDQWADFYGKEITTVANDGTGRVDLFEIRFLVEAGQTKQFNFDYDSSSYVYYTTKTTGATNECKNQGFYKTKANSGFDFTKVAGVTITPLNATGWNETNTPNGDPSVFPYCYGKLALTNATFDIVDFKLGNVASIVGISDETIASFNNETVTVYNFSGAVVAQGNLADLDLTAGFYILKSASKTQKIMIK